jgi:hypothetical protein
MPPIPTLANLQAQYPLGSAAEIAKLIGGQVEKNFNDPNYKAYKDTCAIRISRALNYGGDPIPYVGNINNPYVGGTIRSDKGGDDKRYIYSTYDMRVYLNMRYGHGKKFPSSSASEDLSGAKGIIAFGFLHLDLWDGTNCYNHCYFGSPSIANDSIYVWITK